MVEDLAGADCGGLCVGTLWLRRMVDESAITWLAEAVEGGTRLARIGRRGSLLIADFEHVGRLVVDRSGAHPQFQSAPDADPVQRAKIERGAVRLLLRSLDGKIGLHGSAVSLKDRAIIFVGQAGAGKSTLAAAICKELAAELLADDAAAIDADPWVVVPTEEKHFLDGSAMNALKADESGDRLGRKAGVVALRSATTPSALGAIVRLTFDDEVEGPRLRQLDTVDAVASLIPHIIRFAIDEPERHRVELDVLTKLATETRFFELIRPRRYDQLPVTIAMLSALEI